MKIKELLELTQREGFMLYSMLGFLFVLIEILPALEKKNEAATLD
ncbi:hypothetical protein [Domibacillus sp. A3M-37]|nr:hypothetical protein [Domibacillus sp. A3M-37]